MITKDNLKDAYSAYLKKAEPIKIEFKKIEKEFDEKFKNASKSYLEMLEKYYDEQLVDSTGNSIKIGCIISKNKVNYEVVDRGMQFIFGEMLYNPRVRVRKLPVNSKGKIKDIFPHELKEFEILENIN